MPGTRRVLPIIAALAVALGVAGCGGSDDKTPTVPAKVANNLLTPLTEAQDNLAAGNCEALDDNAQAFIDGVNGYGPDEVDPDIKSKLQAAGAQLKDLANAQCVSGPSGDTGPQAATQPKDEATAEADSGTTSTDETTTTPNSETAAEAPKPDKNTPAKTKAKPKPPAQPATPAKSPTPAKAQKNPDKDKGPKKNGPPGPAGNPNHSGNGEFNSGGVTPGKAGG